MFIFPRASSDSETPLLYRETFSLSLDLSLSVSSKALLLLVYRIPDPPSIRPESPLQDQSGGHRYIFIHSSRPPSIDDIIIIIIVDITSLVTEEPRHAYTFGRYDSPTVVCEPPLSSLTLSYLPTRYFC